MVKSKTMAQPFRLTFREEVANCVSHGVMAAFLLLSLPYFTLRSYLMDGTIYAIGTSVFLTCLLLMFLFSTLYHMAPYGTTYKLVYRKLDHIMILFAIAGSYTPVCLMLLQGWKGYTILGLEWAMVILGVILKAVWKKSHPAISMSMYMVMGWLAIAILPSLLHAPFMFVILILVGGLLYSIGAVFYSHPEKKYFHFIWHLCIVAASISHMFAILFFLV